MDGVSRRRWRGRGCRRRRGGRGGGSYTCTRETQRGRRREIGADNGDCTGGDAFHSRFKPHLKSHRLVRRQGEPRGKVRVTKARASDRDPTDLDANVSTILQRNVFRPSGLKYQGAKVHRVWIELNGRSRLRADARKGNRRWGRGRAAADANGGSLAASGRRREGQGVIEASRGENCAWNGRAGNDEILGRDLQRGNLDGGFASVGDVDCLGESLSNNNAIEI